MSLLLYGKLIYPYNCNIFKDLPPSNVSLSFFDSKVVLVIEIIYSLLCQLLVMGLTCTLIMVVLHLLFGNALVKFITSNNEGLDATAAAIYYLILMITKDHTMWPKTK